MDFEIEANVFCHDLRNPPAHDRTCEINLQVTNPRLIEFTKKGVTHSETVYSLNIPHSKSIGFTNSEQRIFINEFNDLILAFNLVLPVYV